MGLLLLVGAGTAFAHGGFFMMKNSDPDALAKQWTERVTQEAALLGISTDEMKVYWSQGKTLWDIAKEKGVSNDELATRMKAQREDQIKKSLQVLVDKGVITQAQADARLKVTKEFTANFPVGKIGRHGRGMMW